MILNDLLLKFNNTLFQIDTLIIFADTIYSFEVKNFEGDYYFDQDLFYKKPKIEVTNPLTQLNKCESLLRQLLHQLGIKLSVKASLVFINPEFTLYQAPLHKPFNFPTQISRFLKNLNTISSKLDENHKMIAKKLISLHIEDSPYKLLPSYEYCHLKKGVPCAVCDSFSIELNGKTCSCKDCGHEELIENAVMRCVHECKLLFSNEKITTSRIHEWCDSILSKRQIIHILEKFEECWLAPLGLLRIKLF